VLPMHSSFGCRCNFLNPQNRAFRTILEIVTASGILVPAGELGEFDTPLVYYWVRCLTQDTSISFQRLDDYSLRL
jgi:hypothetical protein